MKPSMSSVKVDIENFDGNDFAALNSKELNNKVSDTQDGAFVVHGRNKEMGQLEKNTCSYCYKEGHWEVDCPKLKGKKKAFDESFASVEANIGKNRCSELL
ncbi:phosphatidylinositol 4-kinase alpha 1-like [Pyrus ussuriensis x Pyrus communis]|uniref:Phosphatidylinositol 4-kinase alpha 1-like n=1 Tax=Pyrus ussuriensis x Pyrus communis TaxID=2448454 RepID=A0A5N5GJT7_9ROSA|nr:phosphatidylinositol 4-kinase alpha 1-like [Pyrus ussuriensis x Pyrus communis]